MLNAIYTVARPNGSWGLVTNLTQQNGIYGPIKPDYSPSGTQVVAWYDTGIFMGNIPTQAGQFLLFAPNPIPNTNYNTNNADWHIYDPTPPPTGAGIGLTGTYHLGTNLSSPVGIRLDPTINFNFVSTPPTAVGIPFTSIHDFSVRWTGLLYAPYTGNYIFHGSSDDGIRVTVDGLSLFPGQWRDRAGRLTDSTPVSLTVGQPYSIQIDYYSGEPGGAGIYLGWSLPGEFGEQVIPQQYLYPSATHTATPTFTPTRTPTPTATRTPTATPWPTCAVRVSGTTNVNVRAEANSNATIIGLLFPNQQIVVSALSANDWYQFWVSNVAHYALASLFTTESGACSSLPSPTGSAPTGTNNSGVICVNVLMPVESQLLSYCETFIYNNVRLVDEGFRAAFQQTYGRAPTLQEYIGITVGGEWWAIASEPDGSGLVRLYGIEGFSRAYFEICGLNGCGDVEFLWFLSGYQPWLIGSDGLGAAVDELMSEYSVLFTGSGNPTALFTQTISDILSPADPSWRDGSVSDQPWQWFNRNTANTRPNEGTNPCTEVLLRLEDRNFEMYTAAQDFNLRNPQQCP